MLHHAWLPISKVRLLKYDMDTCWNMMGWCYMNRESILIEKTFLFDYENTCFFIWVNETWLIVFMWTQTSSIHFHLQIQTGFGTRVVYTCWNKWNHQVYITFGGHAAWISITVLIIARVFTQKNHGKHGFSGTAIFYRWT